MEKNVFLTCFFLRHGYTRFLHVFDSEEVLESVA